MSPTLLATEITLAIERFEVAQLIDVDYPFATQPKFATRYVTSMMAQMLHLMQDVAVQKIPEVVKYPATWWDAVKQRWFPAWALKRWPVCETVFEAWVLYPQVAIPEFKHTLKLHRISKLQWPTE